MSAEANVSARTPLAAHWITRDSHGQTANERFVFFQDPQGRVRYASGGSAAASTVLEASEASLNSQFAVLGWGWHTANRRLYYITPTGDLSEHTTARPGGPPDGIVWRQGGLRGIRAAGSGLAAVRYPLDSSNALHFVFYQDPDTDEISEVNAPDRFDAEWQRGSSKLPAGIKGTSIAATTVGNEIRLYYQTPDSNIVAYVGKAGAEGIEGWTKVEFASNSSYSAGAPIAATYDKVITVSVDNKLNIHGPGGYQAELGNVIPAAPVAAIGYPKIAVGDAIISVYTQRSTHRISELVFKEDLSWTEQLTGISL